MKQIDYLQAEETDMLSSMKYCMCEIAGSNVLLSTVYIGHLVVTIYF